MTLFYPHELFDKIKTPKEIQAFFKNNFPDAFELIGADRIVHEFTSNPTGSLVTMKVPPLIIYSLFSVVLTISSSR